MADSLDSSERLAKRFEEFLNMSEVARQNAELRRDYRNLKQWTEDQAQKLKARDQAAIVFDRYSKKVDALVGLEIQKRSDPKALPIKPRHEEGSEVITDGLRAVESRENLDDSLTEAFEDKIVEGWCGIIVPVEKRGDEMLIRPRRIPWDRIYFDPHSRNKDFSDSGFFGITLWMDLEDAVALNKKKAKEIRDLMPSQADETFQDRPRYWIDFSRKRIRINQEYYLEGNVWKEIYYCDSTVIIDAKPSPYLDEYGQPMCPIELDSDFVDRDNNRYGYMERFIDPQNEVNHRRSKALAMLSSAHVMATAGAFLKKKAGEVLAELRKPFSFLERAPNSEVEVDRNIEMGQSQLAFYQDAQNEMDESGINPELSGRTDQAISGRAYIARQQSGMVELAAITARHSNFKKRVYNQIWLRMRQYWTEEKWVRVSDNKDSYKFIGMNIPITFLEKTIEQRQGVKIDIVKASTPGLEQRLQEAYKQDPRLAKVVEIRNNLKELHVDITIEEGPDSATLQQEQFETIAQLATTRADPQMFRALVMLSNMPNKKEVLELFEGDEQQAQAQAQEAQQLKQIQLQGIMEELKGKAADTQKTQSEIEKNQAQTQEILSKVPLNLAQTKDELASAQQRLATPPQNTGVQ